MGEFADTLGSYLLLRLRVLGAKAREQARALDKKAGGDLKPLVEDYAAEDARRRVLEALDRELRTRGLAWRPLKASTDGTEAAAYRVLGGERVLAVRLNPWRGNVDLHNFGLPRDLESIEQYAWAGPVAYVYPRDSASAPSSTPGELGRALQGAIDPSAPWTSGLEAAEDVLKAVRALGAALEAVYGRAVEVLLEELSRAGKEVQ